MSDSAQHPGGAARGFVPLATLRRQKAWQPSSEAASLESLGQRLQQFASDLPLHQQKALLALLGTGYRDRELVLLGAEPAAAILEPEEMPELERLRSYTARPHPSLEPALVLIMKGTRYCNLRCSYCGTWKDGPNQRMPFRVLARAIHGALTAPGVQAVEFFWHGGEPTILPVSFYRKALWLQEQFRRPGQQIRNTLQTNATRLTDDWIDLFKRYRFNVEVSLDGPPEIHDRWRLDVAGRPTSQRVREGIETLRIHGIDPALIMVVGDDIMELGAERLLSYFLEIGARDVGMQNLVPEGDGRGASPEQRYIAYTRFVGFLRELFRLWWPDHTERIAFREISDLLRRLQGESAGLCLYNGNCMGNILTIEPSGDITACDKFQEEPEYRFGNLLRHDLAEFPASPEFIRASAQTTALVERGARNCPWSAICHTGCPFNWHVRDRLGEARQTCCGLSPLLSDMATALGDRAVFKPAS